MTPQPPADLDLAAWLGDQPHTRRPDPLLSALDTLYAAGPDPETSRRALTRLQRALSERAPRQVYYDRLKRTPVGDLFFAVSEAGVLTLEFTSSEAAFLRRLRARTGATPVRSRARTGEAARQLREFLSGRRARFDLPLDLSLMRSFQRQVLLAAAEVPRGEVTTYAELARRIGRPRAARAVGQALGHNPIPIILPCHRVLASDGSLGGYSAPDGVRTKARLLALEGARLSSTS
ncbi:MAG: methylated-DNA--[protein]-cysteine S-methyltransferase [Chloroflexota bacterium]